MGSSGVDFARQLAERDQGERPTKKFRSSAAPKGTKLASGYRDRTQERVSVEEDEKASRVKALEEMLKLQQIDQVLTLYAYGGHVNANDGDWEPRLPLRS